jgi:hypothetical protein
MSVIVRLIQSSSKMDVKEKESSSELFLVYDQVCSLIDKINYSKDSIFLKTDFIDVDFYFSTEDKIGVEIYDARDGFWGHAEITAQIAKKIIEIASENEYLDDFIPLTNEEWGAFGRNG